MLTGVVALFAAAAASVSPPPQAGPWHQLGTAVTSRPGKQVHFYRTAQGPKALGLVVTSTSSRPIHLYWVSYCEFESDDGMTQETDRTATGVHSIVAYPPVFDQATLCYVWINARVGGTARVSAAVFAY
jgi:hypothetical protein